MPENAGPPRPRPTRLRRWAGRLHQGLSGLARSRRSGAQKDETPAHALGHKAEGEAARHFRSKGYRILERNFSCKQGEIDLIVFKDGVVAFVEVRSRTEPAAPDPLYSVNRTKQRRIVRAGQVYVSRHALWREDVTLRFDVVAIRYDEEGKLTGVEHIEDAFQT